MRWPQITMIILLAMNVGINLVKHGEPKNENYNVFRVLIAAAIECTILYFGGFFG